MRVTTGAAGNARLGIYQVPVGGVVDYTLSPLLLDSGALSVAATPSDAEATIAIFLDPGWYILACVSDVAPSVNGYFANISSAPLGWASLADQTRGSAFYRSFTYAALPDPFGGTLTYIMTTMPAVRLRVLS